MNTVLNALVNHVKKLDEKITLIDLCVKEIVSKTSGTQHIIILCNVLNTLNKKTNFVNASDFDKSIDRIYNSINNFTLSLVSEYKERASSQIVEEHFIDSQIYDTRISLILNLIFKGKMKKDSEMAFHQLLRFLIIEPSQSKNLQSLLNLLGKEDLLNKDNALIFFDIFKKEKNMIKSSDITMSLQSAFEKLFTDLNIEYGALKVTQNSKYTSILRKNKILYLDTLWKICL